MEYRSITGNVEYWCRRTCIELEHRSWQLFYTAQILWIEIQLLWCDVKIAFYSGPDEPGPPGSNNDRIRR